MGLHTLLLPEPSALRTLNLRGNALEGLDLARMPELAELQLGNNRLRTLSLAAVHGLRALDVSANFLTELDLSKAAALERLAVAGNSLSTIDLSACPALQVLDVSFNNLGTLELSSVPGMQRLFAAGAALERLDIGGLHNLRELGAAANDLEVLDFAGQPLRRLFLAWNRLETADLRSLDFLETVDLSHNRLESLLLSPSSPISELRLGGNRLRSAVAAADRLNIGCRLFVDDNRLPLSELDRLQRLFFRVSLGSQREVLFERIVLRAGESVDLGDEALLSGQRTEFALLDEEGRQRDDCGYFDPQRGRFVITTPGRYRIRMRNPAVPGVRNMLRDGPQQDLRLGISYQEDIRAIPATSGTAEATTGLIVVGD